MRPLKLIIFYLFLVFKVSTFSIVYSDDVSQRVKELWGEFAHTQTYYKIFQEGNKILKNSNSDSEKAEVQAMFGTVYYNQKMYRQAEKELKKALKYNPHSKSARWTISVVYFQTGRIKKGIDRLEKLTKDYPEDSELFWMLGDFYLENNQLDKAIYYLERKVDNDEAQRNTYNFTRVLGKLADSYRRKNNLEKAYKYAKEFLKYSPEEYLALLMFSEISIDLGKNREAIEKLDVIMANFDPGKEDYYLMGLAHYNLKEYAKARYYFGESLKLDENYSKALEYMKYLNKIQ